MFKTQVLVRFAHVDPAGIVFYPRYFEMLNGAVEDYFAAVVGVSFAALHQVRRLGVPTVRLEADFVAPSRLGELLEFAVIPAEVGRSSAELGIEVRCGADVRMRARIVLVCMNLTDGAAVPWPDAMSARLSASTA